MDSWKFYDITHRDHTVCNPLSLAKVDEMIGLLDLAPGSRVLDIGCGKGELLVRLAERFGIAGVGVDKSPYCVADLRALVATRVPGADIVVRELDGAEFQDEPASYDLACCLGASWTFGGHEGTLRALARFVRPGGQVLVGEPFWRQEPHPDYLASTGFRADEFDSHAGNVETGVRLGLAPIYALASDEDDFDRYEALQWRAAARYARQHADDPDLPELVGRVDRGRREYLTWGRTTLGWSLYLFGTA